MSAIIAAKCELSFDNAKWQYHNGYMTEQTWRWYVFFWTWSAARFSDVAGAGERQEVAFNKLGATIYFNRFDRVNALRNRLRAMPL